jgi:hypothetical protein
MVPVLSSHAAQVLRPLARDEIELIPACIEGEAADYFVLNILSVVKCLNEHKTRYVKKWTANSSRPERAGGYSMLLGIVIDPSDAVGHNLFRLGGSVGHIIASRAVKEAFERAGLTGARFRDVCSPKVPAEEVGGSEPRYAEFYEQLLMPLVETYGPVQRILSAIVGFDSGGPVKTCILGAGPSEKMHAFVTCELAVRTDQKSGSLGRYELLTVCDSPEWAHATLSRIAHLSMNDALDAEHAIDLRSMPKLPGSFEGVLVEVFTRRQIEGRDYAIVRCIGITRPEMEFARREGTERLRQRLLAADAYAATRCSRESVI